MKAFLLRVFADTSTVGYYSPHLDGCPVLLPVPEPRLDPGRLPDHLDPWRVRDPCAGRPLAWYMPLGGEWPLHRDPRLDLGFYTEPLGSRGRLPSSLGRGWLLVFAAGLAEYPGGFWDERRRRAEILAAYREARLAGRARVYAVAVLDVERVVDVVDWGRAPPCLRVSPHAAVGEPARAVVGRAYTLDPPAPLEPPWGHLAGRLERLARGRFRLGTLGDRSVVLDWLSRRSRLVYTGGSCST